MSKRVTNVVVEGCTLYVYFSDCDAPTEYDISGCTDTTPVPKQPGDAPDPFPDNDTRCRVAWHVAEGVLVDRFIDFVNAATPAAAASFGLGMAAVASAKIAAWAWSAALYPELWSFGMSLNVGGDRAAILAAYDGNEAAVLAIVREALYCVLPENGAISEQTKEIFRAALVGLEDTIYVRLAEFLGIYPLERLRDEAFEASITEDAVDCEAFDCEESEFATACTPALFNWPDVGTTPMTWEGINGSVDTAGWTGEPITLSADITGTAFDSVAARNPNENWKRTGAVSPLLPGGGRAYRYMAVVYTPAAPCVVTSLRFGSQSNSGNGSKMMAIAVQRPDDSWHVVINRNFTPAPQTDTPGLNWVGDPITAKAVMFITGHYRGSTTITVQIRDCQINT